jgi:DNA-binding transcriptional regulator YiaG
MANLAIALKEEIARLARKEIKTQVGKTKQAVARYRREIAALKRRLDEQSRKLDKLSRQKASAGGARGTAASDESDAEGVRFSARSVRAQRRRLDLSAEKYGQLVGVSGLTIYNWEQGKSRPRRAQLEALVAVRNIGKREALQRLAQQETR